MHYQEVLAKQAATIASASPSKCMSSLSSFVLASALCALTAAAFAKRSACSFPYMPTWAGTWRNETWMSASNNAVLARLITFHRSAFESGLPARVHPSISHPAIHLFMPSTHNELSLKTTRCWFTAARLTALRTARMIADNSALLLVCLPRGIALMLCGD